MIKPFDIVSTRQEPDGTGVLYRVAKRTVESGVDKTMIMEGYLLLPPGENVDAGVYARLKYMGFVE